MTGQGYDSEHQLPSKILDPFLSAQCGEICSQITLNHDPDSKWLQAALATQILVPGNLLMCVNVLSGCCAEEKVHYQMVVGSIEGEQYQDKESQLSGC